MIQIEPETSITSPFGTPITIYCTQNVEIDYIRWNIYAINGGRLSITSPNETFGNIFGISTSYPNHRMSILHFDGNNFEVLAVECENTNPRVGNIIVSKKVFIHVYGEHYTCI